MSWWRRGPSFSPIHRYAQRLLRSDEAALRTRCFSRTPSKTAQHEDEDGSKRPTGMSNLDWMQLQHYKQWRKRLSDDPYQAIFGASNDMLSGRGLKHWEWVSKTFPRWMLQEMKGDEDTKWVDDKGGCSDPFAKRPNNCNTSTTRSKYDQDPTTDSKYPNKVEIMSENSGVPKERESHFPQPSIRATRIDRDDSIGIVSPSDLRRPREQSHVKVVGPQSEVDAATKANTQHRNPPCDTPTYSEAPSPIHSKSAKSPSDQVARTTSTTPVYMGSSGTETSARESLFIDQFFADKLPNQEPHRRDQTKRSTWRETVLQRRSSHVPMTGPEAKPAPNTISSPSQETMTLPFTHTVEGSSRECLGDENTKDADWPVRTESSTMQVTGKPEDSVTPVRSTSKILSQLPEDDIDFLSAAEIRAAMGSKKSQTLTNEGKQADRQKLEVTFKDAHKPGQDIDPMIESKIINDQLVRRIEREMRGREHDQGIHDTQKAAQHAAVAEAPIESSIDRMRKWLEQGGAIFSSHFWQDPTEEADAKKTRLFFDKVLVRIRKGRIAMRQVVEDLETDIAVSKPLLKRLKGDEDLLDSAIHALRQRVDVEGPQSLTPKKLRAIQTLRLKFQDTDRELDAAYTTLWELGKTDAIRNISLGFERRLSIASKIIRKNAHLTRYLIWSLQARLEDPEIDRSMLVNYKAVANSLLTLRDTQMALARLVDRAMLVYGIVPKAMEDINIMGQTYGVEVSTESRQAYEPRESGMSQLDKARIRADVAAEERLANEVEAQKSAMRGLSDDGYARAPKTIVRKSFDMQNPLAHSLFRPFGPVLDSLGKEARLNAEVKEPSDDTKRKLDHVELVTEVRKAYEDTYGPITVGHRQLADVAGEVKNEQEKGVKPFELWKDDPISSPASASIDVAGEKFTGIPEAAVTAPAESPKQSATVISADKGDIPQDTPAAMVGEVSEATYRSTVATENISSITADASTAEPQTLLHQPNSGASFDTATSPSSVAHVPTHYTILIHDPQTDDLKITTSTGPPRDTSTALPLHQAFSTLDNPAKFVAHITEGLEVVTAKRDMLVLRYAMDASSATRSFETVKASTSGGDEGEWDTERRIVNPIDGTARLSPTGYVGPEESQEQLEKEFEERRRAAENFSSAREIQEAQEKHKEEYGKRKEERRGGKGGILKTAIWAAAACYIVGVFGEVVASPLRT